MIVIGHKGGHAIARFFLGSVAEQLASSTKFPLWIHRGEKVRMPKNILIPSDLSKRSDKTISEVNALKKTFNSNIEIYHVLEEPMPILDYANWSTVYGHIISEDTKKLNAFKDKYPALKTTRGQGSVIFNINRHAEKEKFDVIAISPHEKAKDRVAFGRITGKIIRSGDKPVLVIP
jgi:nucleotide-binding universal stress UspA family protein